MKFFKILLIIVLVIAAFILSGEYYLISTITNYPKITNGDITMTSCEVDWLFWSDYHFILYRGSDTLAIILDANGNGDFSQSSDYVKFKHKNTWITVRPGFDVEYDNKSIEFHSNQSGIQQLFTSLDSTAKEKFKYAMNFKGKLQ